MADRVPARLTAAEGRKFAFTVGGAFLVLAAITWWREHPTLLRVFGTLGGLFVAGGLVAPAQMGPVQRAWMGLAHAISKVTTPIFMGVVYFLVITPTSLVMTLVGKRPLTARRAESLWTTRPPEARRSDLERQF